MRPWLGTVLATGALLATGCASGPSLGPPVTSPSSSTTGQPATRAAPVASSTSLPPGTSVIGEAVGKRVDIYSDPAATSPSLRLPNPWFVNNDPTKPVPQVFLTGRQRADGWTEVLLPVRPNGSRGWVRTDALRLLSDPFHIDVSLGAHSIEVWDGMALVYRGPVATGALPTPTPVGDYYLRVLLRSTVPQSVYGPFAYGLSAHSDALTSFDGSDAEVGIHGNNDASVLGQSVTHGCVRMDNSEITKLAALLPLGTPVHITE